MTRYASRFADTAPRPRERRSPRKLLRRAPAFVGIALVWLYRITLRPLVPANTCKYHPTCSQYALDALHRYGLVRGSILAGWRLLRCNPWSRGGVDYVEDQRLFT